jgi:hypothetical protein
MPTAEKEEQMSEKGKETKTELQIGGDAAGPSLVISGQVGDLHNDPAKVHQLLDLLKLPKGTQVKVMTTATSVIVR